MAKWKLSRQTFGSEELIFLEGDKVTIGRGLNNTITLSSIVISRNHCVIHFKDNEVMITDLKSSNGIYVGLKRIPANIPYALQDSDIIGFGWIFGAPLVNITDSEKYIFKLTKENNVTTLSKRILFQKETDLNSIETALTLDSKEYTKIKNDSTQLKRKFDVAHIKQEDDIESKINVINDVVNILSDSDIEIVTKDTMPKKIKYEKPLEEHQVKKEPLKSENDDLQYEAFSVKQEYLGYDDEPVQIDSDSDSESEHWFLRLSQSSPGKPFTKIVHNEQNDINQDDSSYSQAEDFMIINLDEESNDIEEEYMDDLITIPLHPPEMKSSEIHESVNKSVNDKDIVKCSEDTLEKRHESVRSPNELHMDSSDLIQDEVDGNNLKTKDLNDSSLQKLVQNNKETVKKIQVIEPLVQGPKKNLSTVTNESKVARGSHKHSNKKSSSKTQINNTHKEERKKKLKEIATKEKEGVCLPNSSSPHSSNKPIVNAKVSTSNRGAFLTDSVQASIKPIKRKASLNKSKDTEAAQTAENVSEAAHDYNKDKHNSGRHVSKKHETSRAKNNKQTSSKSSDSPKSFKKFESGPRIPLKSVKPLKENDESMSGKPFSKVEPLPPKKSSPINKSQKTVRFTDEQPIIHVFEIEPGNKMKKTSSIKTSLLDVRQMPVFSLEKITLMKILRWNPHWLNEQINNNDPPPILGHNNPPMAIFHSFNNHKQYIQLVGDLLLMEIWECLTQGYMRLSNQNHGIQMRIDSLPPVPPQERCFDLFNLSVNISLPTSEIKSVPRVGEVLLVTFGGNNSRFLFVHNVRCLPSPPNNIHSFFTISLYATFTEKMGLLRPGEIMYGKSLAYINKELMLFEAMEHLAGSPLSEAILKPEPRHFVKLKEPSLEHDLKSQWTITLNPSQKLAVCASVSAALGDKPCIQMVQGPPGTGKSSVICAIVMTYFYNAAGKKQQNRGKILICATSNAAVDELVIRLLNIRQSLPKAERFRMVRVGRAEAMHPRARDVSSQQLAQRDAQRAHAEPAHPAHPALAQEISHIEAKINMWKTQAQDARDPVRIAYCQSRIENLANRINMLRGGGGGGGEELRPEQVARAERRIVEGADIVVTTLASAHNHKMKGLRRRIALCIVDEAGQAIEPETLIPLTLDVTRLTLIGDPQQLPGFICSQRAKSHGLGESLFSRLTSCTEHWDEGSPVVLLNQQYRMHSEIADYPNRAFYDGKIQTMAPPRVDLNIPPYCIISITSGDKGQGASGANETEAWGVARLAAALGGALRARGLTLAVITPYSAHRDMLRRCLRLLAGPAEAPVEVNTVDSFQGQERDAVVVSLARSHGVGFLTDAGRMNVMLTRARHALLVCLNPLAVTKNLQWRTLIEDAQRRKVYRMLPNKMCQGASAAAIPHDEILKYVTNLRPNKA